MDECESLVLKALDRTAVLSHDIRVRDVLEGAEGTESNSSAASTNSSRNSIDNFPDQAGAVLRAAAIGICALVDVVAEELVKKVAILRGKLADGYRDNIIG